MVGASALYRLAAALDTTVSGLEGVGFGQPEGSGRLPGGSAHLEILDRSACMQLIRPGGIGRLVFDDGRGPVALPVNFRALGDDLVFQTGGGTIGASVAARSAFSLEVDHFDDTLAEGWSVLVRGNVRVVTDPDELAEVDALQIESWAGQPTPITVRVVAEEVTGRRIRRHL